MRKVKKLSLADVRQLPGEALTQVRGGEGVVTWDPTKRKEIIGGKL